MDDKTDQSMPTGKQPTHAVKDREGKKARKVAILVAGMHRSGTSALARTLSLLGCDLPKTLMPASGGNEAGYWESQAIANLNDELLESCWFGLGRLGSGQSRLALVSRQGWV